MDDEIDPVKINEWLLSLPSDEARLEAIGQITAGICEHCGRIDPLYRCQCWNDE